MLDDGPLPFETRYLTMAVLPEKQALSTTELLSLSLRFSRAPVTGGGVSKWACDTHRHAHAHGHGHAHAHTADEWSYR